MRPLRDEERAEWKRLPFNETRYRKELGAPKLFGESGYTTLERTWARPTLEVNGLLAGFTGEGAKTVIPAVSMAKVSMRLVPDQDPDTIAKLFEDYVRKITPKTVELKVTRMHGGKPWMTDFDNPFVQAAGRAIEKGFGKTPVFNREGGSIPVVATFQEILRLAVGALRRRPARRERARPEREARSRQLPRRHRRVGVPLRRDGEDEGRCLVASRLPLGAFAVCGAILAHGCADPERERLKATTKASYDQATGKLDRADLRRQQERAHRYLDRDGRDAGRCGRASTATRTAASIAGSTTTRPGASRRWAFRESRTRSRTRGRIRRRRAGSIASRFRRPAIPARIDRWEFYDTAAAATGAGGDGTGPLLRVEEDTNRDGRPDKWERYESGLVQVAEFDENRDGRPDRRLTYRDAELVLIETAPDPSGRYTKVVAPK